MADGRHFKNRYVRWIKTSRWNLASLCGIQFRNLWILQFFIFYISQWRLRSSARCIWVDVCAKDADPGNLQYVHRHDSYLRCTITWQFWYQNLSLHLHINRDFYARREWGRLPHKLARGNYSSLSDSNRSWAVELVPSLHISVYHYELPFTSTQVEKTAFVVNVVYAKR